MSKTLQKIIKFSKGEINQELNERSDIDLLNNSASYIKNYIPTIFGGLKTRFGSEHILKFNRFTENIKTSNYEFNYIQSHTLLNNIDFFKIRLLSKEIYEAVLEPTFEEEEVEEETLNKLTNINIIQPKITKNILKITFSSDRQTEYEFDFNISNNELTSITWNTDLYYKESYEINIIYDEEDKTSNVNIYIDNVLYETKEWEYGEKEFILNVDIINNETNIKIEVEKNLKAELIIEEYKYKLDINNIRVVPFVYSNNDYCLIILTENNIFIIKDDVEINTIDLSEDLKFNDLEIVKYSQYENMICWTEPTKKPRILRRIGGGERVTLHCPKNDGIATNSQVNSRNDDDTDIDNGEWEFSFLNIINIPYHCFSKEVKTKKTNAITPSAVSGAIGISGSGFTADMVGQIIDGNGGRLRITKYESASKIYGWTIIPFWTTDKITNWTLISGYEPSLSDERGWPNTCLFYQERLFFGGSKSRPLTLWGSRINQFNDFDNVGNYANDSIDIDISSNDNSQIVNLFGARGLSIFTEGAEFLVNENSIKPNGITVQQVSNIGSNKKTEPIQINSSIVFLERKGRNIYSFDIYASYDYKQSATSNCLSLLNNTIIKNPINLGISFNSNWTDGNFIFIVNEDGTITLDNFLLEENINSFSRVENKDMFFYDVVTIQENTYFLVKCNNQIHLVKLNKDLRTDLTIKREANSLSYGVVEINDLDYFNNKDVRVYYKVDNQFRDLGVYKVENNKIILEDAPLGDLYIGLDIECELISNNIQINNNSNNIKKRIAQAVVTTTNTTEKVTFNNKSPLPYILSRHLENEVLSGNPISSNEIHNNTNNKQGDKIYKILNCTNYDLQTRFNLKSCFDYMEVKSIVLYVDYGR